MPNVNGKKYPYTPEGEAAAKAAKRKMENASRALRSEKNAVATVAAADKRKRDNANRALGSEKKAPSLMAAAKKAAVMKMSKKTSKTPATPKGMTY
jgi:hypothetical protein